MLLEPPCLRPSRGRKKQGYSLMGGDRLTNQSAHPPRGKFPTSTS
nr:MAG TPA: hypothetical protein [Caudoviricetes sp.]